MIVTPNAQQCHSSIIRHTAGLVASAWLLLLAGCTRSSDEQQIRALVQTAETAFEARDTSAVMALIADGYRDALGHDKQQLRNFLRGYFLAHPRIELLVRIDELTLETPNTARLLVSVTLLGMKRSSGAGLTTDAETLRVELRRVDSEWRVSRIDRHH